MTTILGNDLTWWTGVIGGVFFLLLALTALVKQFNIRGFIHLQIPLTPYHYWFGWLSVGFLAIHMLLAFLQFNFGVTF